MLSTFNLARRTVWFWIKVIQRRQLRKSDEKPDHVSAQLGIIKQTTFSLSQIIKFIISNVSSFTSSIFNIPIFILKIINLIKKNTQFKPLLQLRSNNTFLSRIFSNYRKYPRYRFDNNFLPILVYNHCHKLPTFYYNWCRFHCICSRSFDQKSHLDILQNSF